MTEIEELKEELEKLKKQNLEKEVAVEKAKLEKVLEEEKNKEQETLREQIRSEVLKEMEGTSRVTSEEGETLGNSQSKWERFSENYIKKHKLTGKSYEDTLKDVVDGGF